MSASETVWRIARQFDSIRHSSPTVIETKDINQPTKPTNQPITNQTRLTITVALTLNDTVSKEIKLNGP